MAATALPRYSYCSNGRCMAITNEYFHTSRGMPLDLSFVCKKDNQYALTFDDGPSSNYNELLDILKKHNVKATFFINGQNINQNNINSIKRAYLEHHDLANHTLNHIDLTSTEYTSEQVLDQVKNNRDLILDSLNKQGININNNVLISTKVVRPPYGNIDQRVDSIFKQHGYYAVRWNGDRYDWNLTDDDQDIIYSRIIQQLDFIDSYYSANLIDTNAIMDLNHDFRRASLLALDKAIPIIKQRGYEFVTITECLGV